MKDFAWPLAVVVIVLALIYVCRQELRDLIGRTRNLESPLAKAVFDRKSERLEEIETGDDPLASSEAPPPLIGPPSSAQFANFRNAISTYSLPVATLGRSIEDLNGSRPVFTIAPGQLTQLAYTYVGMLDEHIDEARAAHLLAQASALDDLYETIKQNFREIDRTRMGEFSQHAQKLTTLIVSLRSAHRESR